MIPVGKIVDVDYFAKKNFNIEVCSCHDDNNTKNDDDNNNSNDNNSGNKINDMKGKYDSH